MTSVILLVDDERPVREFLAQALEELGYRTLQAVNGRQALNVISRAGYDAPDLIMSDVMMPVLGGVELCRAIKSNPDTTRIPVILMSGTLVGGIVGAHADAFIGKPFDLDALDVLIESTLASRHHSGGATMNQPTTIAHAGAQLVDNAHDLATVQFRHDQKNSGVSRHGQLHPGGRLRIEYDPARLIPVTGPGKPMSEVVCHLRFQPSGEQHSGALAPHAEPVQRQPGAARPLAVEVRIPSETTRVDLWFEGRAATETTGWDSRYGQNFSFPVTDEGLPVPEHSVVLRPNTRIDATRIHVVEDAAFKQQVAMGSSATRLQTALVVRAEISEPFASVAVWADAHVFDAMGDLLHAVTITFEPNAQTEAAVAERRWEAEVYPGSGGASGMGVWSRPDAHTVNYRLYCQIGDQIYTDGVLHQFEVPTDTEVRPIPGGW